jgi:hypothetical protein
MSLLHIVTLSTLITGECFRYFTAKKTKNCAQFTEDEQEIINEIITICVAKIHYFLKTHYNPKQHASEILKLSDSKKNFALVHYLLGAVNISPEEFLYPKDENEKLAKEIPNMINANTNAIRELVNETSPYLESWEMTEVLQQLANDGIFENVRGKNNIKKQIPGALPRQRKGEGYEKAKREGYYSVYKISNDLVTLNEVISNPKAMQYIYNKLKDYGVLKKFYLFKWLAVMYALREGDDNMLKLATVGAQETLNNNPEAQAAFANLRNNPEIQTDFAKAGIDSNRVDYSGLKLLKNYLLSLTEEQLEKSSEPMVDYLVENPIDHSLFLLSLSEL